MPLDAAIEQVFVPYRPGGCHGRRFRRKKTSCGIVKGMTICHMNEFVQSHFSDGNLIVQYINKMATNRGDGVVDGMALGRCKPFWSQVEIPTRMQIFFH